MLGKHRWIWTFAALMLQAVILNGLQQLNLRLSGENSRNRAVFQAGEQYIAEEMKCFPIPIAYRDRISYEDTYGANRDNGSHEGCDMMDRKNAPGEIPVISAADGVVTNVGWLYLGGWRVGITSAHGVYYYYAHLDSYAAGLAAGKEIKAGELLGFMGNSGEGEEGTKGKFATHLHFGLYIRDGEGNEKSIPPYSYLLEAEKK